MNKLKKRIYRVIDRLAYKVAIRSDRISKWAYWKLLDIEKKEYGQPPTNITVISSAIPPEGYEVAELFDVPPVMLNLMQGNNHKSKEETK